MSLWLEMVSWHTASEKAAMKLRLKNSDSAGPGLDLWQDCIEMLDGIYFVWKFKPYPDERSVQYFNHRKKFMIVLYCIAFAARTEP